MPHSSQHPCCVPLTTISHRRPRSLSPLARPTSAQQATTAAATLDPLAARRTSNSRHSAPREPTALLAPRRRLLVPLATAAARALPQPRTATLPARLARVSSNHAPCCQIDAADVLLSLLSRAAVRIDTLTHPPSIAPFHSNLLLHVNPSRPPVLLQIAPAVEPRSLAQLVPPRRLPQPRPPAPALHAPPARINRTPGLQPACLVTLATAAPSMVPPLRPAPAPAQPTHTAPQGCRPARSAAAAPTAAPRLLRAADVQRATIAPPASAQSLAQ